MTLPPLLPPSGDLDADGLARYSRQLILGEIGVTGQRRLAAARVLVIGAGGLGSPVLLYLAAAGVGTLGVVDFDRVEKSNLHRQVIHRDADVGRPKVDSAADAVAALNPTITVHRHEARLTEDTVADLLAGYDLVIDGADNFPTRYLVNDACVAAGKPLVWGSVLGFAAQVAVFWEAAPDGNGVQLRDVFPEPPPAGSVPSCAEAGVVGALCAQAGSVMAMEAIKLITGLGRPLLGRILVIDALGGRWDQLEVRRASRDGDPGVRRDDENLRGDDEGVRRDDEGVRRDDEGVRRDDTSAGAVGATAGASSVAAPPSGPAEPAPTREIRLAEADTMFLLDVRGPDEFATERVPGSVNVPLTDLLEGTLDAVPDDRPILVICRSGRRAEVAAASLEARGYRDVQVLAGGLAGLG